MALETTWDMKRRGCAVAGRLGRAALVLQVCAPLMSTLPAQAQASDGVELTLKRVLLSTGGVGYFEYEGQVTGNATLPLTVRRDQVDDVLKSIVVYDDAGGVGTIALPGNEPLKAVFDGLPFPADALDNPVSLLTALKGAPVRATGSRTVEGRLLSVQPETTLLSSGATVTRHRVTLMTASGLQHLILEDTESLTLADPETQAQLDRALSALARQGEQDRRTLSIRTTGSGSRTVRVAYVAEAPLWKATYRLTLPAKGTTSGDLQGWAVLENHSGADWSGVDLTVVSGNPVTFRQALYDSYYVTRPQVPVEVLGRILPRPDDGTVPSAAESAYQADAREAPAAKAMMAPAPAAAPPPPAPVGRALQRPDTPAPAQLAAADSTEATSQVVFRAPQPVTLVSGESLMLPIVARSVPVTRVDLFQPATHPRNPLAAVRLDNGGAGMVSLPPGVLTLYERADGGAVSYVGDARMGAVPAGEQRLLSFSLDQKLHIDRSEQPSQIISAVTAADGVMTVTLMERQTTTYTIAGSVGEERTVVIEHPRRPGWTIAEPKGMAPDTTADAYRLPLTVPADGKAALTVTLERPRLERVVLADLSTDQLGAHLSGRTLPPALKTALERLMALRVTLTEHQRRSAGLEKERAEITAEQDRLRDNLGALPKDSDLYKRTLVKMSEQETRLDALAKELAAARRDSDAAQKAVSEFARGVRL